MPPLPLAHLDTRMRAILREARAGLAARYRERLKAVLLYGSWARGTAGPESDVDLLVVLDRMRSACAEVDSILEAVEPTAPRPLHLGPSGGVGAFPERTPRPLSGKRERRGRCALNRSELNRTLGQAMEKSRASLGAAEKLLREGCRFVRRPV